MKNYEILGVLFAGTLVLAGCGAQTETSSSDAANSARSATARNHSVLQAAPASKPARNLRAERSKSLATPPTVGRLVAVKPKSEARSRQYIATGRDKFERTVENAIKRVREQPVSTFSIDVDTASYGFVRRMLNGGTLPQNDAVRLEELINYFNYDYPQSKTRSRPFQPTVTITPSPWREGNKLVHIGIKGYDFEPADKPRSNLVFLLDVS